MYLTESVNFIIEQIIDDVPLVTIFFVMCENDKDRIIVPGLSRED